MSVRDTPCEELFTDIATEQEARPYVNEIKPMYYIPRGGAITTGDWLKRPRTIFATKKDKAIVPALQKQLCADFEDEMVWIVTGHTPFW